MSPEDDFAEFYRTAKDRCLRAAVASGMPRALGEEAVAEAFSRAWASWPTVRRHPAPTAWVMRTAFNYHVSHWRRARRQTALDEALPVSVHDPAGPAADRYDLVRALAALPARQRAVIALRLLLDLDTAQTAAVLGIAPGTVTAHLHQGLATLRHQPLLSQETSPS